MNQSALFRQLAVFTFGMLGHCEHLNFVVCVWERVWLGRQPAKEQIATNLSVIGLFVIVYSESFKAEGVCVR